MIRILDVFIARVNGISSHAGCPTRWTRRSRSPESASRRRLFERSEFPRHLIRGGGGGTLESLLLSKLGGAAHGRKWFWFLLPKQKGLVARGRNPAYNNSWKKSIRVENKKRGQEKPGSPITNVGDDRIEEKGDRFISLRIVSKGAKESQALNQVAQATAPSYTQVNYSTHVRPYLAGYFRSFHRPRPRAAHSKKL